MKALINYLVDLCLLRATPQDLPASNVLLVLFAAINVLVGVAMVADARPALSAALFESAFSVVLMLGILYLGLKVMKKPNRFVQTGSALMGAELVLSLLTLPLISWSRQGASSEAGLLLLVLLTWSLVVLGHILRHAFDIKMGMGIGIALLYTLVSWNLLFMIFPTAA